MALLYWIVLLLVSSYAAILRELLRTLLGGTQRFSFMLCLPCGLFIYGTAVSNCLFRVIRFGDTRFGVLYPILSAETRIPKRKEAKNSIGHRSTICLTL